MAVSLRPARPADDAFLLALFEAARPHLVQIDLPPAEKQALVVWQFEAQRQDYERRFPDATKQIILRQGNPVGLLWRHDSDAEIRLLDIALMPANRNAGIGTTLLNRLKQQAENAGKPLRYTVQQSNQAALRLYLRRGFTPVLEMAGHILMEWQPASVTPNDTPVARTNT